MVIRTKCKDGTERIDWVKTIVSMSILGAIVLLGLNLSIESNARSKETAIEVKMIKELVSEMKIDQKEFKQETNKKLDRIMGGK